MLIGISGVWRGVEVLEDVWEEVGEELGEFDGKGASVESRGDDGEEPPLLESSSPSISVLSVRPAKKCYLVVIFFCIFFVLFLCRTSKH